MIRFLPDVRQGALHDRRGKRRGGTAENADHGLTRRYGTGTEGKAAETNAAWTAGFRRTKPARNILRQNLPAHPKRGGKGNSCQDRTRGRGRSPAETGKRHAALKRPAASGPAPPHGQGSLFRPGFRITAKTPEARWFRSRGNAPAKPCPGRTGVSPDSRFPALAAAEMPPA